METLRQISAFMALLILLSGGIGTLLTGVSGYLAAAIVAVVFVMFFLAITMDEDYHG